MTKAAPAHVPPELVIDIDWVGDSGMRACPHARLAGLHAKGRMLYNVAPDLRHPNGLWVPTRNEDIRAVLQDAATFSSRGMAGFAALAGESWDLIPTEIDPPEHGEYRAALNPLFSPSRINAMEKVIRERANELIASARAEPAFDFVATFGTPFPVSIFLDLMGLPKERLWEFVRWTNDLLHGESMAQRQGAAKAIVAYLRHELADRRTTPRDDVMTYLTNCQVFGRNMTDDELIGAAMLIFGGGIDTVASSLGFHFLHLARHPELQERLRRNPAEVPNAVEEFLRAFAIVGPHRRVTRDVEFAGVQMKAGDWVLCSTPLANTDPEAFPNALDVDVAREGVRHATFSYGPHRCLGSHLARRELAIALEAWLEAPAFALAPDADVQIHGGTLLGVDRLPMVWANT